MSIYLKPILTACYLFPVLAVLFTIPYMIHQYNKYGSILILRTGVVYTFIFYMMTSYFMTILPLPAIDSVTPESATMLLVPFDAVNRWLSGSHFDIANPATYIDTFTNADFLQILFNILLLLPFGVYLRYYFNRKWYQVLLLSFLYSLFFELTQLSGLYGIYPYPYRFFEVDDLICNTLGGMLGFALTPALLFFLPNRQRLDEIAYKRGEEVSSFRRIFALLADYGVILLILTIMTHLSDISSILPQEADFFLIPLLSFVYFTLSAIVFSGVSLGKFLVNIRIVNAKTHKKAGVFPLICRNALLHVLLIPCPYYIITILSLLSDSYSRRIEILLVLGVSFLIALAIFFVMNFCFCFAGRNKDLFYDKICGLTVISTTKQKSQSSL